MKEISMRREVRESLVSSRSSSRPSSDHRDEGLQSEARHTIASRSEGGSSAVGDRYDERLSPRVRRAEIMNMRREHFLLGRELRELTDPVARARMSRNMAEIEMSQMERGVCLLPDARLLVRWRSRGYPILSEQHASGTLSTHGLSPCIAT